MTAEISPSGGGGPEAPRPESSARLGSRRWPGSRRKYLLAGLLLLAAVAAGAVLGAAGAILYFEHRRFPVPPSPEDIRLAMLQRLGDTFQLTPAESDRLSEIIRRHLERTGEIRRSSFSEIRGEFEAMYSEVGECLGPERFRVWDELEKERWQRLREKSGPPHRGQNHNRHGGKR
ncbi:MAG: hypothetical protein LBV15_01970 [Planctomycetota bacterium]|jgi:hypothetical protein|nr:hypothetical protein [Planctomycetota bacterium]